MDDCMSSEEEKCYSDRDSYDVLDNEESDSQWVPPKPSSVKVWMVSPFFLPYPHSICMYICMYRLYILIFSCGPIECRNLMCLNGV